MILKILLLVSNLNLGDVSQADAILRELAKHAKVEIITIDASQSFDLAKREYLGNIPKESYITLVVGEKAMGLFKDFSNAHLVDDKKTYTCLSIHQFFNDFDKLPIDHIIVPKTAIDKKQEKEIVDKIANKTFIFAAPTSNLSKQELKKSYDNWTDQNKPNLQSKYIIIMMPGDAPNAENKILYFTKESAKKLFYNVYKLWQDTGKEYKIIIQNGPRTGKFDQKTGDLKCSHEYQNGQDPRVAIDEVSYYFMKLFDKAKLAYSFWNFAFEIDADKRKTISYFYPLLYLSMQNENIFILPGESVSMIGQIPLYLPSNRIILFMTSSMNEDHKNIFNLAYQSNYLSYFAHNGEIIKPKQITKRLEDDAKQIAKDIFIGFIKASQRKQLEIINDKKTMSM